MMQGNPAKIVVTPIPGATHPAHLPAPVTEREASPDIKPRPRRKLDLGLAIDAASARLSEQWFPVDTSDQMVASGLAQEFASTLCAYGMLAAESDHMLARIGKLATREQPEVPGGVAVSKIVPD